jgi:threonine dehydrogenase-like Zn-dependent dehydrogenase
MRSVVSASRNQMLRATSKNFSRSAASSAHNILRSIFSSSCINSSLNTNAAALQSLRAFGTAANKSVDYKNPKYKKLYKLEPTRRLVVLGFGAIGQGVLPLLYRHIDMKPDQVVIISNEFSDEQLRHAGDYGAQTVKYKLTRNDYKNCLKQTVKKGDFLINVSIDVSSVALIEHCQVSLAQYLTSFMMLQHTSVTLQ